MNLIPRKNKQNQTDIFGDLLDIQKEMNDLFDFSLSRWNRSQAGLLDGNWNPAVDIYDSKDNLLVKADLPGLKKEEIDISVHEGTLFIKGEKKQESEKKEKGFVRTERYYGSFSRAIPLPTSVDDSKVKANYKNGVLELVIPKKEEAKPKQIKVEAE
jgi:HSP20 family protein